MGDIGNRKYYFEKTNATMQLTLLHKIKLFCLKFQIPDLKKL